MSFELRRAEDGFWHIALDNRGVYIRIGEHATPVEVSTEVAKQIGEALVEVTDGSTSNQ